MKKRPPPLHKTPGNDAQGSSTTPTQREEAELYASIAKQVPKGKVMCIKRDPPSDSSHMFTWHFIRPNGLPVTVKWEAGRYEVGKIIDESEL